MDKVYKLKNLELAWEKVRRNGGAGGIDGQSIADFEGDLEGNLRRLHEELRIQSYQPHPVKRQLIPKGASRDNFARLAYRRSMIESASKRY